MKTGPYINTKKETILYSNHPFSANLKLLVSGRVTGLNFLGIANVQLENEGPLAERENISKERENFAHLSFR